jgi:DNA-binding HxlR family transcriptional regulator
MVWWAATVAACFGSDNQCTVVFLVAIFLCQIVFGIYGMVCEARERRQGASMPELPELNPVIHGKLRLALLSLLIGVEEAEFTWLRAKTGSTDGNLGAQLLKLEEAGYVTVEKKFVQRKPQTLYRMTEAGRRR